MPPPSDWGRTPDSYLLPQIVLDVPGAGWLSGAAVGAWSLDRELVASTIPGNIRQRTGLSIGSASVTVRPVARSTPWAKTPARRVTTGIPATLYAEDSTGDRWPLGSWVTDETDGDLSGEGISVDLLEASYAGRDVPPLLPAYANPPFSAGMPIDPVWPIARLLEQVGFPASPRPSIPDAVLLVVPMDGAIHATAQAVGASYVIAGEIADGWSLLGENGLVAGGSGSGFTAIAGPGASQLPIAEQMRGGGVTVTLEMSGTVWLLDVAQGWLVRLSEDGEGTCSVAVHNALGSPVDEQTFATGESEDWPGRVQVQIERTWSSLGSEWTSTRARGRSSLTADWSAWSEHSSTHSPDGGTSLEMVQVVGGVAIPDTAVTADPGRFAAVAFTRTTSYDGLYEPPKAVLQPLGGDAGIPWAPAGDDVWQVIQDYASANLGAVIIGLDGIARVLTRADLAGATEPSEPLGPIDVGAEFDDLPWAIDPEDSADRVEVTYTPPAITDADVGSTTLAPVAWQAEEILSIPAGETITIPAVFEGRAAVGIFETFVIPGDPSPWWSQSSTVIAFDNPDAVGSPLPESALRISVTQTSPTTATIKVQNRHGATVYLVDGNGEPCLILRARSVATFETPQVIESGASKEAAQRPLEVNLTPWVQSKSQAQAIADYLWGRVSGGGAWKAVTVRCRLDWSLEIGQVRPLVHGETDLRVQALVTKVHYDGSPEQIAQSLDLVLVPWTYADFAAIWASAMPGATYADQAAAQGDRTYADFATDPLWTGA